MNLFENILAKAKTNFANPDPTQNLQFKALQGAANLYTGVAEEAAMGGQREFERRKEVARQFLSQKGYTPDVIDNTLSQIEYKPSFMGRVREGLGNRMLETAKTTDTLSNVQNPLQRLGVGTLAYGGDVVATAMEPIASAISPIVQTGIEKAGLTPTVQNLGQQFQGFKERNPLTGEAIEGVANVSQLAPVPLGKPLAKVATQGGKAIVKTAEAVAPKVVQGAKFATDIATAPVKSIVNTARKYVATPEEISGIQSAIKPKQRVKNGVVQRSQDAINNEITLTNSLIRQSGEKPTDLATYKTAIKSEMEKIGSEINRLTGQDLTIDITPSTAKLRQLANSDIVKTLDPADTNALLGLADRLDANGGRMSLSMAEEMNQWLNSVLKDTTVPKSEAYKRGLMTLVEDIRNGLDDSISSIPGEFKEIKRAYGALRNVYGDTVAREIVFNRQNMGGLVDSIGAIEGAGSIVSGGGKMLMGDLKGGVADIGRGIASNAVGRFIKSKNDPNNIIRAIFEKGGNKSTLPNIPNKPTNGNIPRNSANTSPVLDMGTTKKVEGKVIKPAKAKPIVKPSPQVKPVEKTVKASEKIDAETKKVYKELGYSEGKWDTIKPVKYNGKVVGGVDAHVDRFHPERMNISYIRILPEFQGKGLGTNAIKQLFKDNPNIDELVGHSTAEAMSFWKKQTTEFTGTDKNIFKIKRSDYLKPKPLSPQKTVKPKNLTEGKQSMGDMETKKLKKPKALRVYDVIKSKNNDITAVPFDDFYSLARVSIKGMTKDKAWGLWMNKMIQKVEKGESIDIEILKKYPLAGSIIKDFLKTGINPFE